jgi:hypothetical protein
MFTYNSTSLYLLSYSSSFRIIYNIIALALSIYVSPFLYLSHVTFSYCSPSLNICLPLPLAFLFYVTFQLLLSPSTNLYQSLSIPSLHILLSTSLLYCLFILYFILSHFIFTVTLAISTCLSLALALAFSFSVPF